MPKSYYSLKEFANLLQFSESHIRRRLTESPQKYRIKYAHKCGGRWRFNRLKIDNAIQNDEPLFERVQGEEPVYLDEATRIRRYFDKSESAGNGGSS